MCAGLFGFVYVEGLLDATDFLSLPISYSPACGWAFPSQSWWRPDLRGPHLGVAWVAGWISCLEVHGNQFSTLFVPQVEGKGVFNSSLSLRCLAGTHTQSWCSWRLVIIVSSTPLHPFPSPTSPSSQCNGGGGVWIGLVELTLLCNIRIEEKEKRN